MCRSLKRTTILYNIYKKCTAKTYYVGELYDLLTYKERRYVRGCLEKYNIKFKLNKKHNIPRGTVVYFVILLDKYIHLDVMLLQDYVNMISEQC